MGAITGHPITGREGGGEARRGTVLLVDDDPLIQLHEAELIAQEGYAVVEAASGDAALAMLEADPRAYDVLVTDVDMPGALNGLELARVVDEQWPWVRVVVTSAHADLTDADVPDHGRFLPKPWGRGAIEGALRAAGRPAA